MFKYEKDNYFLMKKGLENFLGISGLALVSLIWLAKMSDNELGTSILPYDLIDKVPVHGTIKVRFFDSPADSSNKYISQTYNSDSLKVDVGYASTKSDGTTSVKK